MIRSVWLVCGGVWLASSVAWAGAKTDADRVSTEVIDTLRQESDSAGAPTDRRELLHEVRESDGNSYAWWHSGYVKHSQGWQSWEASPVVDPQLLRDYQQRRDDTDSTAAAQLKLADWCQNAGLKDQERVHLMQALRTGSAANPPQILRRLGYRQVGGSWFTEAELTESARQFAARLKDWKRISPQLEKLATQLVGKPRVQEKASLELCKLADRDTALFLEQALAGRSEVVAQAVVQALSGVNSYQASQSLARIGVGSPWESVRESATAELQRRSWDEFVPLVLDMLHEPMKLSVEAGVFDDVNPGSAGQLEWRFIWSREGRQAVDVAVAQLMYRGDPQLLQQLSISNRRIDLQAIAAADQIAMADAAYQALLNAERFNDSSQQINQRAGNLLAKVTDQPSDHQPADWWNWWDRSIADSPSTEPKTTNLVSVELQTFGTATPRCECLVAGTPVWTEEGFRPIESVRIGDRVLSKNIETGELKYQPVLQTARRSGATVANVKIGGEIIEASLGHHFWVSGRGWTRVHQLAQNPTAHTPTGTVSIEVAEGTRTTDVYNLVVADYHTYFVGQSMILGHDVLVPAPTDIRVPGLDPNLTASK